MTVRVFVSIVVLAAGSGLLWLPARAPASSLDDLRNAAGRDLPDVPEPSAPTPDDDGYAERRERYRQMQEEEEREREARQQRWEQEARERQERDERARQEDERRQQEENDRRDEQRREQQRRDQEEHDSSPGEEYEDVVRPADRQREEQLRLQADQQRRDQEENARQAELRRQEAAARQERLRQEQLAKERREQEERARQEALRRQQEEEARQARLRAQAAAARAQWAADDERNGNAFDDIFAGAAESDPNVVDLSDSTSLTPALLRGGGPRVSLRAKAPPLPRPEVTVDMRDDPPPPPPRWHPDMKGKLTDLGFAYVSMYLKSKVDGLASIPELTKDALDLRKRLSEHTTGYLDKLFATAGQAADPNADLGALSERTWTNFETAAANYDEDARRGMQNNAATMSSGSLPEGSSAAEVGIGQGQAQLQDVQELRKWTEEHASDSR